MTRCPTVRTALVALLPLSMMVAGLAGCTASDDGADRREAAAPEALPGAPSPGTVTQNPTERFDADDRRAARALSLGDPRGLEAAGDAYRQALICTLSIESIAERLEQGGALGPQQQQAMEGARALFADRAARLAATQKRSTADRAQDRASAAADIPDMGARARLAIACIQQLQTDMTGS